MNPALAKANPTITPPIATEPTTTPATCPPVRPKT